MNGRVVYMKKSLKVAVVSALCLACVMLFTACSTMPKIQKAFENDGWTVTKYSSVQLDEYGKITMYGVTKSINTAIILEGEAGTKFIDAYNELKKDEDVDAALKLLFTMVGDTAVVNGNCAIITISPKALEVFNSVE